ncbi:MAG TPA: tetratricopeptide repeat protein [Gammaproteobacteria bacterium]|nr:tetratricopeptide repeat protein [Gammaproteobacteria bacterium]
MAEESLSLLARFKRHHIYRVATIYAVAAWIIIQLTNGVFPDFGMPRTSVRIVIVVLLLGFPVVLMFAWLLIKPVDPEKLMRWQKRRWRLGLLLTAIVIVFVGVSGAYIWQVTAQSAFQASQAQASASAPTFAPPPNTVAVLPFRNLGSGAMQYLSDGLTQELTDDLSQFPGMQVIAWQTMHGYRDTSLSVQEIGKRLNVAYILTGSVMRDGEQLRASAALASTTSGNQVWSSRYDQGFKDVFAMQDSISRAIAGVMQLKIAGSTTLVATATQNPRAHDAYLKGKAAFGLRTAAGLREAIKQFQRAIKLDPQYAEAYAQLAGVYNTLPEVTYIPLQEANDKATHAVKQALAINPNLAAAHAVLANIYTSEQKLDQARAELLRTLALDPNNASAHYSYGVMLPLSEALYQYQQAALLDPDNWAAQQNLGTTYAELGKPEQAMLAFQAAQSLSPDNIESPLEIAFLYHTQSKNADAVNTLRAVKPTNKGDARILDASLLAYEALQDPALRNQALNALNKLGSEKNSAFFHYYVATAYVVLGEIQLAVEQIARFCGGAPDSCNDIAVDNHYTSLHGNPQFQTLVSRYGLKHR